MTFSFAPTLAFNYEQWLLGIGIFVAMAISWISNILKEKKQRRQAEQQTVSRGNAPARADKADRKVLTPDELAARRRAQLQKMAQGGSVEGRSRSSGQPEPANLTMAERVRRARAKAEYERRAGALRTAKPPPRPSPTPAKTAPPPLPVPPRARSQKPGARIAQRQLPGVVDKAAPRPRLQPRVGSRGLGRGVPDAGPVAKTRTRTFFAGKSLRDAILLKEILDRPLSLREP